MLETAKNNIRHNFAVVGVMDHLPLFKRTMEEVFDMESTVCVRTAHVMCFMSSCTAHMCCLPMGLGLGLPVLPEAYHGVGGTCFVPSMCVLPNPVWCTGLLPTC